MSLINGIIDNYTSIKVRIEDFILNHSKIAVAGKENVLEELFGEETYKYEPLDQKGKQLQIGILKEFKNLYTRLKYILQDLLEDDINTLDEAYYEICAILEQSEPPKFKLTSDVYLRLEQLLNLHSQFINLYFESDDGKCSEVYVPDTNALLSFTDIENWFFNSSDDFTLYLTPVVLRELDKLKVYGKNAEVRDKSKTLVRKIKSYLVRGDISEGVKLAGKRRIKATYLEPNFRMVENLLNPDIEDDRLIACIFEIQRNEPIQKVILVTGDLNLTIKAAALKIQYVEPPEKQES